MKLVRLMSCICWHFCDHLGPGLLKKALDMILLQSYYMFVVNVAWIFLCWLAFVYNKEAGQEKVCLLLELPSRAWFFGFDRTVSGYVRKSWILSCHNSDPYAVLPWGLCFSHFVSRFIFMCDILLLVLQK